MIINNHYCVIDTETGGLVPEKNPICEIAFVILNKDMEEVHRYSKIIKPYGGKEYAPQAMAIHGIKMSEIENGIDIKVALTEIESIWKSYCKGRGGKVVLIGHNMQFDFKMLNHAFNLCGMDIHKNTEEQMLDTMWQARLSWGHDDSMENFKLPTCCERAGIDMGDAHRALGDVLSTAKFFIYLVEKMRGSVPHRVASEFVEKTLRKHDFKF